MKTVKSSEAETSFSRLLHAAQSEPVIVTEHGLPVGVVLSIRDCEDLVEGREAMAARMDGMMGREHSAAFLDRLLKASD